MNRTFLAAIGAILISTVAFGQTPGPTGGHVLPGNNGRDFGCNASVRQNLKVSPAYLAVNDPCLPSLVSAAMAAGTVPNLTAITSPAAGDGRRAPATYHMVNGSNTLYLDHTASIDVTASGSGTALTISPAIARSDWFGAGETYTVFVPGQFSTTGGTTNAASAVAHAAGVGSITNNVLTVTSCTSCNFGPNMLLSDASGNLWATTEIISDGTGTGGAGTYNVANNTVVANIGSQNLASETLSADSNVLSFASGGTSFGTGDFVADTTNSGAIQPGTVAINNAATFVWLSKPIQSGISSGDTITNYLGLTYTIATGTGGATINLASSLTTAMTNVPITLTVTPSSYKYTALHGPSTLESQTWSFWRHGACTVQAGSTVVNCPAVYTKQAPFSGSFALMRDQTPGSSVAATNSAKSTMVIHDPSNSCPDQVGVLLFNNQFTATLDQPATCTPPGAVDVYWGSTIATATYQGTATNPSRGAISISPGTNIEVPGMGTGSTNTASLPLDTTVTSVIDPLSVDLAVNAQATPTVVPVASYLRWGTNDTAPVADAEMLVSSSTNPGWRYVYWPPGVNTYLSTPATFGPYANSLLSNLSCGEGTAIWPLSLNWVTNTSICAGGPQWHPEKTTVASQNLKQARATAATGTAPVIAISGDSWFDTNSCGVDGGYGCAEAALERAIGSQNNYLPPTFVVHAIGGATLEQLDPLGPSNPPNGPGIPGQSCPSAFPDFFSNCSQPWLTYLEDNTAPVDSIIMRFSNDAFGFSVGSLIDIVGLTQGSAWHTAAGRYPDLVLVPGRNSNQGSNNSITIAGESLASFQGQEGEAGIIRTMARSGWFNSTMGNGGSIGWVDADQATAAAEEGYDPVDMPSQFATELVSGMGSGGMSVASNALPYVWQSPTYGGYSMFHLLTQPGTVSLATFEAAFGNGLCYGVGGGASFTPQSQGSQPGANTMGYPGGAFCVDYNAGTTHWNINRYLYRVVETPAACTYTAATNSTIVCTTSVANYGYANAQVWVCGTGIGSSTSPAFMGGQTDCINGTLKPGSGSGNGVSADGKTLTLTSNLGATQSSQAVTIMLYLLQPGDPTDTGCTPTVTANASYGTSEPLYFYVRANGDVGISEQIAGNNSAYPFQEGATRCQWKGRMAGFFDVNYYPEVFAESNASVANAFVFGYDNDGSKPSSITNNAPAFEEVPWSSRLTPILTPSESWGLQAGSASPFGGVGGYQHTGSKGVGDVYHKLFGAQDWSLQP